jgi:hypothetical protein
LGLIGSSASGKVYHAKYLSTSQHITIKISDLEKTAF